MLKRVFLKVFECIFILLFAGRFERTTGRTDRRDGRTRPCRRALPVQKPAGRKDRYEQVSRVVRRRRWLCNMKNAEITEITLRVNCFFLRPYETSLLRDKCLSINIKIRYRQGVPRGLIYPLLFFFLTREDQGLKTFRILIIEFHVLVKIFCFIIFVKLYGSSIHFH